MWKPGVCTIVSILCSWLVDAGGRWTDHVPPVVRCPASPVDSSLVSSPWRRVRTRKRSLNRVVSVVRRPVSSTVSIGTVGTVGVLSSSSSAGLSICTECALRALLTASRRCSRVNSRRGTPWKVSWRYSDSRRWWREALRFCTPVSGAAVSSGGACCCSLPGAAEPLRLASPAEGGARSMRLVEELAWQQTIQVYFQLTRVDTSRKHLQAKDRYIRDGTCGRTARVSRLDP